MRLKYFFVLMVVGGLFFRPSFARAQIATDNIQEIQVLNQQIAEHKDKIKQLEDTIGKYKKNIDVKQTEAVSLKNQISILDNRLAQAQGDIDLTNEKIKQTELEIEALVISIKEKQQTMEKQKKVLTKMLQEILVSDQKNYLEIALTYSNFADFYNELQGLQNVSSDIGRAEKTVRIAKQELDAKKIEVQNKKQAYLSLQQELQNKKQDLTEQSGLKQKLLADTKYSESKYRTLLDSLKQQYQVIESEERGFEEQVRKKLAAEDKIAAGADVPMSWPVPSRYISATFHDPEYPFRNVFQHSGVDIRAAQGTPVHAAAAGYVARAKRCSTAACYSYVLIVHTGSVSSLYGHLSGITVADDAFVNRGDVIGYSGATPGTVGAGPFVTGPHLHFEVRLNGLPVDPLPYLIQ